ncbi:MAG: phosphatidylserine/phosphatidylglycerophosphate/cardiolipin synthase family protein [Clostridiales bacterium]|nr:phosphatidylserine/phosphatidylglycerophosphate/cardiolipin synthase family protein [Candidatus Cacconaster stercorequi]
MKDGITLLTYGHAAFTELLSCIAGARKSIEINMFIWRQDAIGNRMARAILEAADRGVRVHISVDRVGAVLEYAEESGKSLFHKHLSLWERVQVTALSVGYPDLMSREASEECDPGLYERLIHHQNIVIEKDVKKADHSKFYVFDEETLVMGGVNIEDKENGCDARGVVYQDYMVKLQGKEYVAAFREKRENRRDVLPTVQFVMNKKQPHASFELEEHYLTMIRQSHRELTVVMAYFAPMPAVMQAILEAAERGVRVRILLSARANYQDNKNKWAASLLMQKSGGKIEVYLSPLMLHTKLIISDDRVSFGSGNITKKSFYELDELNMTTTLPAVVQAVRADVETNMAQARQCRSSDELRYHPVWARLENLFS